MSVTYEAAEWPALVDVSLTVATGEAVSIVSGTWQVRVMPEGMRSTLTGA